MASPEAFSPIEAYLKAEWTATPVAFENDGFEPPKTASAFVRVEIFGTYFAQASIGEGDRVENLWREAGMIYLHVCVPRGSGSLPARTYCRQLADLFRGQDLGNIRFRDISIGAAEVGDEKGNYFRMTVTIEWERDEP